MGLGQGMCPKCDMRCDLDNHECPGTPSERLEYLEDENVLLKERVAALEEERKRLRVALRQVAEDEDRTEREKELLLDLVEALGGEAAG